MEEIHGTGESRVVARTGNQKKTFRSLITSLGFSAFVLLICVENAAANLFISPSRVEIGSRDRGTRISLVNTTQKTRTYRMSWREQAQTPGGQYAVLGEGQKVRGLRKASDMIKFSPSLVTLKPGERQHVRLAIRRPGGLADGEYRSHLVFEALPEPLDLEDDENQAKGARIIVQLNMAFSIPIILRQGEVAVQSKIAEAQVFKAVARDGSEALGVKVKLTRAGDFSSSGRLKAFWTDKGSDKAEEVGLLNNVALYTEVSELNINVGLNGLSSPRDGTLHITYEGVGAYEGIVFDEITRVVTAGNFLPKTD